MTESSKDINFNDALRAKKQRIPDFIYYVPPHATDVPINGTVGFVAGTSKDEITYIRKKDVEPPTKQNLFATPKTMEDTQEYLAKFNGGEGVAAVTCAFMMFNLMVILKHGLMNGFLMMYS